MVMCTGMMEVSMVCSVIVVLATVLYMTNSSKEKC